MLFLSETISFELSFISNSEDTPLLNPSIELKSKKK